MQGHNKGRNKQNVLGQLRNNNIVYIAYNREKTIREYTVLTSQAINHIIVKPEVQADNFKLKTDVVNSGIIQ